MRNNPSNWTIYATFYNYLKPIRKCLKCLKLTLSFSPLFIASEDDKKWSPRKIFMLFKASIGAIHGHDTPCYKLWACQCLANSLLQKRVDELMIVSPSSGGHEYPFFLELFQHILNCSNSSLVNRVIAETLSNAWSWNFPL